MLDKGVPVDGRAIRGDAVRGLVVGVGFLATGSGAFFHERGGLGRRGSCGVSLPWGRGFRPLHNLLAFHSHLQPQNVVWLDSLEQRFSMDCCGFG